MRKLLGDVWKNLIANFVAAWIQSSWQSWGVGAIVGGTALYVLHAVEPAPLHIAIIVFLVVTAFVGFSISAFFNRAETAPIDGERLQTQKLAPPTVFYDERDPNCYQPDGRVFTRIVGERDVEHDETIYRLGIRSEKQIRACRLVLADVEPKPHDPGQQRIGLALRPRIPVSSGSEEFVVNRSAPAFVDVLQEVVRKTNPLNEWSRIKLIYVNEDRGRANWFENGEYVLTFRLEGPIAPVFYKLAVSFDQRRQYRRWRVRPA